MRSPQAYTSRCRLPQSVWTRGDSSGGSAPTPQAAQSAPLDAAFPLWDLASFRDQARIPATEVAGGFPVRQLHHALEGPPQKRSPRLHAVGIRADEVHQARGDQPFREFLRPGTKCPEQTARRDLHQTASLDELLDRPAVGDQPEIAF